MMLEVLQFYVSGFWVWAALTFGPMLLCLGIARVVLAMWGRG